MPINYNVKPSVANKRNFCDTHCTVSHRHKIRQEAGLAAPSGWTRERGYSRPFLLERAIEKYNANPKICKGCGIPIPLKTGQRPGDLWNVSYCTKQCSNSRRKSIEFFDGGHLPISRAICTTPFELKGTVLRGEIGVNAKRVYRSYNSEFKCELCGKELFTFPEVAHIKPVSSFSDDTPVLMINQLSNLIGLCSNDHKDFDNGFIPLERIQEKVAARKPRP
jgi:hypothetical protein